MLSLGAIGCCMGSLSVNVILLVIGLHPSADPIYPKISMISLIFNPISYRLEPSLTWSSQPGSSATFGRWPEPRS